MFKSTKKMLTVIVFSLFFLVFQANCPLFMGKAYSDAATDHGLTGFYYDNKDFSDLKTNRIDPIIDFNWGLSAPLQSIGSDTFSIKWYGYIEPVYNETYTFYTASDDGIRLWVNEILLIDKWIDQGYTEYNSTPIILTAGVKYSIKVEYYDNQQNSAVKLMWSSPSQPKQVIPQSRLYPISNVIQNQPLPSPSPINTSAVNVNLSNYFNEDAFSYDSNRNDGNIDGSTSSYSAELFNPNLVYENASFNIGSFANGSLNSMKCMGQKIDVPIGTYSSVRILGAATNGDKSGILRLNYSTGSYWDQIFTQKDWCATDITNQVVYQPFSHRHYQSKDDLAKNYVYINVFSPDITKNLSSIVLPDNPNMHILAITLIPTIAAPPVAQPGVGNGLKAEYYDKKDLSGSVIKRIDSNLNFNWDKDAPFTSMEADSFSVRWSGYLSPRYSQDYTLFMVADDGVRLWIDDRLVINEWHAMAGYEYSSTVRLNAGTKHKIKVEYYEDKVLANVKLMWSSANQPKEIIPQSQLYTSSGVYNGEGSGLTGEYFNSHSMKKAREIRIDQTVNFDWGNNSAVRNVPKDNFSVKWSGYVQPRFSEKYNFHTISDDGVRVWVNDKLLIDRWYDQNSIENEGQITLEAGKKYKIRIHYYEARDKAVMKLFWSSPSQNKEIIPKSQLYPYFSGSKNFLHGDGDDDRDDDKDDD